MTGTRTDCQLLGGHLGGDESAFAELAARHAAMVLGVCRRLLGDGPDAEDAAQAVFVLLARRARSLARGRGGDLGAWLHRAAGLVSRGALRGRRRRELREREAAAMRRTGDAPDRSWEQLAPRLDAALDALPADFRQALVLCYFEGLSQAEAAERLAVPESTLSSRCTRALDRLRARLGAGRGLLGIAELGTLIAGRAAGPVPGGFVTSAVSAAKGAAASAPVTALVEGALRMLFWSKVKVVAAGAAALLVALCVAPAALRAASGEGPAAAAAPAAPAVPESVPVDGLRLSLAVLPERLVCGPACAAAQPGAQWQNCPLCPSRTNAKQCWSCSASRTLCEACGKALPGGLPALKELKAGDGVRLALTLENVSKEKLRVCDYMLGYWKVKWEVAGPGADAVKSVATGVNFCLAAIGENNFPELAPSEKCVYWVFLRGNPPAIDQGAAKTCLLKPGDYEIVAVYTNATESYAKDGKDVRPPGKVWKNTVRSQKLALKITGEVKPLPAGRPGLMIAD